MTPEHVAACPGTRARNGVSRVRSSWRRGTTKSASSTVRSPLRSSWLARCGPTPLTNRSGVWRPGGASVCVIDAPVLYTAFGPRFGNSNPGSAHGPAVRCLREGSLGRSYDQPRAQAHEAALASQSGLDARGGRRQGSTRARMHPLPQGGQGHESHLSTNGRGRCPLPNGNWWEAATPHRETASLLLLLLGLRLLLHRASHLLPWRGSLPPPTRLLPLLFLLRRFLLHRITSFRDRSVAHGFAPQVLGLLPPAALVTQEVDIELGKAHDLEPPLLEGAVEHPQVVGREEMQRPVGGGGGAQAERLRDRRRVALEVAVHGRQPEARRQERGAGVQREGVPAAFPAHHARNLAHELARDALGRQVRRDLVRPIRVRLAPRLEQVRRLRQADALAVVALHPGQLLEPLDDVVRVTQAHRRRSPQLLEPPRPAGLDEEHADDPCRAGGEQRAERSRRGADVPLALFLDQDVLEREVAVARQVDEPEIVAPKDAGALRADVHGGGHRVRPGHVPPDLVQPRDGGPDLPRLAEGAHFNDQRVLLAGELELHQ